MLGFVKVTAVSGDEHGAGGCQLYFGNEMYRLQQLDAPLHCGFKNGQRYFSVVCGQRAGKKPLKGHTGIGHNNHGRPFSRAARNCASVMLGACFLRSKIRQ